MRICQTLKSSIQMQFSSNSEQQIFVIHQISISVEKYLVFQHFVPIGVNIMFPYTHSSLTLSLLVQSPYENID